MRLEKVERLPLAVFRRYARGIVEHVVLHHEPKIVTGIAAWARDGREVRGDVVVLPLALLRGELERARPAKERTKARKTKAPAKRAAPRRVTKSARPCGGSAAAPKKASKLAARTKARRRAKARARLAPKPVPPPRPKAPKKPSKLAARAKARARSRARARRAPRAPAPRASAPSGGTLRPGDVVRFTLTRGNVVEGPILELVGKGSARVALPEGTRTRGQDREWAVVALDELERVEGEARPAPAPKRARAPKAAKAARVRPWTKKVIRELQSELDSFALYWLQYKRPEVVRRVIEEKRIEVLASQLEGMEKMHAKRAADARHAIGHWEGKRADPAWSDAKNRGYVERMIESSREDGEREEREGVKWAALRDRVTSEPLPPEVTEYLPARVRSR